MTDHVDLRSCLYGRKGYSIAAIDREEAPKERRSMNGKDCGARTCTEDNYSRAYRNWNHGIRKSIRCSMRRIACKKRVCLKPLFPILAIAH